MANTDAKKSPIALDGPARDRAEESGRLRGLAEAHTAAGMHDKAAELHAQRGQMHEDADDYESAMDAYKAAHDSMQTHVKALNDAAGCSLTPAQVQAMHAKGG